jgi:hypothetical protein
MYEHGYVGLFLPYATPSQYPYPLVVGGMLDGIPNTRYSDSNHSIYAKGSRNNLRMRFVDGAWKTPDCYPWNTGGQPNYITSNYQIRDTGGNYSPMSSSSRARPSPPRASTAFCRAVLASLVSTSHSMRAPAIGANLLFAR